ncbi:MAG: hypothetical protein JO141_25730 [Bradyrhizobium sp.]|nr:hypothetical protein [Bradyrhizobium sp.]
MFRDRKSTWLAVALFCAIALFCLVPLYLLGDLSRFQQGHAVKESQAALRDLKNPEQLEQLLKRYPSNGILKLVALAYKDATAIDTAALGLLRERDPDELSRRVNEGLSSRSDLEALGRDLKAAEDNAAGLELHYDALIKPVRDGIERDAAALEGGDNLATFMAAIDAQHAQMKALISRISAVRLDYFRAYEKCVALMARENDVTKGGTGPITFRLQVQADSYNEAAGATAAGAKRLIELETERTALTRSQLDKWKSWAAG